MVGSNPASGFGRFALCETLESRQFFSVATPDSAFKGGSTTISFGGNGEEATAAAVLPSGRLFVGGASFQSSGYKLVAAVLNRDGSLYKTFDGDGKMTLPASATENLGNIRQVLALPDGGVLLFGTEAIGKVLANGGMDTNFGGDHTGVLHDFLPDDPGVAITDARLQSDGKISFLWTSFGERAVRLGTVSSDGRLIQQQTKNLSSYVIVSEPQFLPDGSIAAVINGSDQKYRMVHYTTGLKSIAPYTDKGIDLSAALTAYFKLHPVTAGTSTDPATKLPYLSGGKILRGDDGSLAFQAQFIGSATGVASDTDEFGRTFTRLSVVVGPDGKKIDVYGGGNTGANVAFENVLPSKNGVNGRFFTTAGAPIDVSVLGGAAVFDGTINDTDHNSVYLIGRSTQDVFKSKAFVVASVLAPTGGVAGQAFNDVNGNGLYNTETETVNAGKVIYLDANNNNVFDSGEFSTTTDAQGYYFIAGLTPGDVRIRRVLPAGYQYTTGTQRYNQTTKITAGQQAFETIGSINHGIVQGLMYWFTGNTDPGTLQNRLANQTVFLDLNKNGKLDAGEQSTTTDSTGFYRLVAPSTGTFRVTAVTPAGYKPSGQPKGYSDVYLGSTSLVNVSFSYKKI